MLNNNINGDDMNYFIKDIPSIANFPDDDKFRVVYSYGPINTISTNNTPKVIILLKEVQIENNIVTLNYHPDSVIYVALNEIRIATLMSVWQRKKKTKFTYKIEKEGVENISSMRAKFDFDLEKPINIPFTLSNDKESDTLYNNLKPKFGLSIDDRKYLKSFLATKYLKIVDNRNRTFFIPTVEFLVSAYTFETQELTNNLILKSLNDILDNEVEETVIIDNTYEISLTKGREITTQIFLAYACCNEVSMNRIKRLRSSIESSQYKYVSPTVLPYHPHKMELQFDCFQFNDNKYLVYNIIGVSSPLEYNVELVKDEIQVEQKNKEKPEETFPLNQDELEDDYEITSDTTPHNLQGQKKVQNSVQLLGEVNYKITKSIHKRYEATRKGYKAKLEEDITSISSSEENSKTDSKNIGKANYGSNYKIDQGSLLDQITKIIDKLVEDRTNLKIKGENLKIKSCKYVFSDSYDIKYSNSATLGDFINSTKTKTKTNWLKEEKFKEKKLIYNFRRKYLLMELLLSNGEYLYLFEIERKVKNGNIQGSFQGLVFSTVGKDTDKITSQILKDLLECCIDNRGVISSCIVKAGYGKTFKHFSNSTAGNGSLSESTIINVIEKL